MNFIYELIPFNVIEAIGWTIFHSLWQGALISIVLGLAILVTDNKSAKFRYALSVTALLFLIVSCAITFAKVYNPDSSATLSTAASILQNSNDSIIINDFVLTSDTGGILSQIISTTRHYFSNYLPLIVTFWFAGLMIFALRFIGGVVYVQRLKTRGVNPVDESFKRRIAFLSNKIKLKRTIEVLESAFVKVPVAIGYLKPVVLLPLGMISGLTQNHVEAIIAHEIAHIKRYDFLVNLIQTFAETLFFYHPSVWWMSAIIRIERENCCDDIAVDICGDSLTYSKALVSIQQMKEHESSFALAITGNENQLLRRIKRMNAKNKTRITYGIKFAAFAVLILIIASVSLYSTKSYASIPTPVNEASFVNPFTPLFNETTFNNNENDIVDIAAPDTTRLKKGKHTFRFYEKENGNKVRYKAKLNDGKLDELYIDGERVPTKDLDKYESKVNRKVDDYEELMSDYRKNKTEYKETMKEYSEKMRDYRKKLRNYRNDYGDWHDGDYYSGDLHELREALRELRHELRDNLVVSPIVVPRVHIPEIDVDVPDVVVPPIHIPEIDIDVPDVDVHIPPIHVPSVHIAPHHFDFGNFDEFKGNMEDFRINMRDFDLNMDEFNDNMKDFGKNMKKFGAEMKKFGRFMRDAKDEMIDDGLIESGDDIDNFTLSEDEMIVNGKTVPPELRKKYLDMYEEHTGKRLEGDHKIRINHNNDD